MAGVTVDKGRLYLILIDVPAQINRSVCLLAEHILLRNLNVVDVGLVVSKVLHLASFLFGAAYLIILWKFCKNEFNI